MITEDLIEIRRYLLGMKYDLLALRYELKKRRFVRAVSARRALKANFNPDQPRDEWGRWTDAGGSTIDGAEQSSGGSDADLDSMVHLVAGHHKVPRGVFRSERYKFSDEVLATFESATTGKLNDPSSNYFDEVHRRYNDAVEEELDHFLKKNKITSADMTKDHAESFVKEIERSSDPRIRKFNLRMIIREGLYWYRRGPRGRE